MGFVVLGVLDCPMRPLTVGPACPGGRPSTPEKPESDEFT
jgi:hypothetical protein